MSALAEGQRLGPYRIVRLLGQGGMGAVYEARQEPLGRRVALKTLHSEHARNRDAVARFFNEAKALSKLEHPSVVQVSDFGEATDGTAYLVMEFLRGQSLGLRLCDLKARGERLPPIRALQIAFQVADVLAVAHSQGIVHRDIKPDNLMLIEDAISPGGERVKLLDFGIAKLIGSDDKGCVQTDAQALIGTPSYMSPEQCAGAGGVDAKTDVYALGCVLYEIFAGRPPFIAESRGQLIGMHLFQAPPPLLSLAPTVPASIIELVHRLITKNRETRPTMTEAADAIGRLLSKQTGGGPVVRSRLAIGQGVGEGLPGGVSLTATMLGRSIGQFAGRPRQLTLLVMLTTTALLTGGALAVSHLIHLPNTPAPIIAIPPAKAVIAPALASSGPGTATPSQPQLAERPRLAKEPELLVPPLAEPVPIAPAVVAETQQTTATKPPTPSQTSTARAKNQGSTGKPTAPPSPPRGSVQPKKSIGYVHL